ncbi:MAG: TPM domain-containing protein [Cyclobacteriaceae bacterium]|nr:TPM domain-containing protein [Cyclobacteriaceae bacterium]
MEEFLLQLDEDRIVTSIGEAESSTSGEIRVHIEKHCPIEVLDRSVEVFANLHMHQTRQRNGVLIYIACHDHKFAIIGDAGINAKVGPNFWQEEKQILSHHFQASQFTDGIVKAIHKVGTVLKQHFPYRPDDINELPDDISYGD